MNHTEHLQIAGVPAELHPEALAALAKAQQARKGLTAAKLKIRLFKAGKIAKLLAWEDERLCLKHPELATWDIAPMLNITAHGDNGPWVDTPEGGRPVSSYWLNKDPESAEYKEAVAKNYWCPGQHPRSKTSRKAWYRRNGGEFLAWQRGQAIDKANPVQEWTGTQEKLQVTVVRSGSAWIVKTRKQLLGKLVLTGRYGFEADNVFCGPGRSQAWFPIDNHELRAPATWGQRLRWQKPKTAAKAE